MLDDRRSIPPALVGAAALAALLAGTPSVVMGKGQAASWPTATYPSAGPPLVIGSYGGACISGAVTIEPEGPGYQVVDLSRRRHYGHPVLVEFLVDLGRLVSTRQLGTLLVGDMAQPRGGPMSSGHVSHQGGLDVDLWFRLDLPPLPREQREGIPQPSVVDPATGRPNPAQWGVANAELVRAAAVDPRVSRVFVGAAIKRDLCERAWPDRSWLQRVRPWPYHDEHLHVRLHCPADSPACVPQPPLPPSEGCSEAELAPAFTREAALAGHPMPAPNRVLPPACRSVLTAAR